jgi:hypothetical protein
MRALRSRPLWQLVGLAAVVLIFVGGAGAAGACKLFLDWHLGSKSSLENEIVRYQGLHATLNGAHPEAPNTPWLAIPHPPGIAITGGVPLTRASGLPANLRSNYAFADWGAGTLTLVPLGKTNNPKQIPLAQSAAAPVRLRVGQDGALYYLAANSGDLRRIAAR